jgi:hypothetical protein
MEPVKFYVGQEYRAPISHIALLYPFWGTVAKESAPYVRAAVLQYQYSKNDFALVQNIEDADFVLMPHKYERFRALYPQKVEMIIREAEDAGKPLLIDAAGDIEHPINIPGSTVLRISQFRYSKKPNEIPLPYPAEDLLESYADGSLRLREKRDRPSVGFTGWASLDFAQRLKTEIKGLPKTIMALVDPKRGAERKGLFFRQRALKALSGHPGIETNFVARASYSGHVHTLTGGVEDNRRVFVENLIDSDYALSVRGDANASVRFYEALSLGRIPLFLDTACVLPLEDKIAYRDFCVFVDWRDTDRIGDILADFHATLAPERFIAMQKAARAAYKDHLRIDAFSRELAAELRKHLSRQ